MNKKGDLLTKAIATIDDLGLETLKKCKYCGGEPIIFTKEAISILKCKNCGHNARGYISYYCVKSEEQAVTAYKKLARSWNERN